ncbi:site-specific integrase [Dactylosporangium sp. NPDC048998]|uniref:site-specific integrase n=1 Tax=Dactylosporangium sp. NPDC048998 TaxID=3363976 RepID=UPI003721C623
MVWTQARVEQWRTDGHRPAVAVWTTTQLTEFLDTVTDDPLYPLWWLIALRGLRRGEAAGLRWQDVDLDRRQLSITTQRTTIGYQVVEGPPKSTASRRTIALDRRTVAILRAHQRRRRQLCTAAGRQWRAWDYVFTRPDGQPFHPNSFTKRLRYLITAAGLPPVRLHDLRHGAASLAHTAGADLKTVQDQLGHASIVLTADTYTSVLPATQHKAAEATARLVLTTARGVRDKIRRRNWPTSPPRPPQKSTTVATGPVPKPQVKPDAEGGKRPKRRKRQRAASKHPRSTSDR